MGRIIAIIKVRRPKLCLTRPSSPDCRCAGGQVFSARRAELDQEVRLALNPDVVHQFTNGAVRPQVGLDDSSLGLHRRINHWLIGNQAHTPYHCVKPHQPPRWFRSAAAAPIRCSGGRVSIWTTLTVWPLSLEPRRSGAGRRWSGPKPACHADRLPAGQRARTVRKLRLPAILLLIKSYRAVTAPVACCTRHSLAERDRENPAV